MERARQTVVYLDTHVIVWLYAGEIERFSSKAKQIIETHPLYFSPLVEVELKYLHEINEDLRKTICRDATCCVPEMARVTHL